MEYYHSSTTKENSARFWPSPNGDISRLPPNCDASWLRGEEELGGRRHGIYVKVVRGVAVLPLVGPTVRRISPHFQHCLNPPR